MVLWLWEETHVLKVVGSNPSTVYWMAIFHTYLLKFFLFEKTKIHKKWPEMAHFFKKCFNLFCHHAVLVFVLQWPFLLLLFGSFEKAFSAAAKLSPLFRYSLDLWGQPRDIDYTPRWRNGPFRYSHNRSPKHKLVLLWRKCGHSQRWEKIGCKIAERNNEWKAPTHKHGKMTRFNEKQVKFRSLWNEVFF